MVGGRKKCCLCRCAPRGRCAPELLLCRSCCAGVRCCLCSGRARCVCTSGCARVRPCRPPARVPVRVTACLQGWHGHTRLGDAVWASPTGTAPLCVQHCACSRVCSPWVPRHTWPRGDEWCWGVPMRVQCCTSPTALRRAVRPQPRVPYTPSHASPAAVELVPGTAKVNSAGARQHGVGKL